MTLVLEIEHLLGVAFAARDQASEVPDWPPQPDRVFSALVASWGARGERAEERQALEWLEAQPAPAIAASSGYPRSAPTVFVPPNDPESSRVAEMSVVPAFRKRQPRRFPCFRPDDPTISLIWPEAEPDGGTLSALNALATDTAYVGHSASLTRCRFRQGNSGPDAASVRPARRGVYRGRLAELAAAYRARPPQRPRPGAPVHSAGPGADPVPASWFSDRWMVLQHVGGDMPDLRAAPLVAKRLRDAIMSGYEKIGRGDAVPAAVSGHAADGSPSREPHLAIAPLALVGWPYANGAVYGFALIPPRAEDVLADPVFRSALRAIAETDAEGVRVINVHDAGFTIKLAPVGADAPRSLDPARYAATARTWSSCTPMVLDRHLKESGNDARGRELAALIKRACANTGLPEPIGVSAAKHSAFEGAVSAYPPAGSPAWLRWRLPPSLASRELTHVTVRFEDAVRGPVILGAGRFVGLGLCLPLDATSRQ